MPSMVDPYPALLSFQEAYKTKEIVCASGRIHPEIAVHFDEPAPGDKRITYALLSDNKPVAIAIFANADPMHDGPCFQIGYAVAESLRNKGLATEVVSKAMDEIINGFKAVFKKFYIEAIVGVDNDASQKLAHKFISTAPENIVDEFSGEPALQYMREVVYS